MSNKNKGYNVITRYLCLVLLLASTQVLASDFQKEVPENTLRYWPEKIEWRDASATLPKGTQIAVLEGNPKKEGMFTIRLKTTKYFKLAVHQHPGPERVTILAGELYVGFGDTFNKDVATKFVPGSFYVNPKNKNHYVFTKDEEAIVQITGQGPWKVIFPK